MAAGPHDVRIVTTDRSQVVDERLVPGAGVAYRHHLPALPDLEVRDDVDHGREVDRVGRTELADFAAPTRHREHSRSSPIRNKNDAICDLGVRVALDPGGPVA